MFSLSINAKEAIKFGLAIVIAYYLAMRFSWMSVTWAAIAVAMISLPTAGQSINKGLLRIGGTLLAFVAGLFYLGMFSQERWAFYIAFTPFLAFVTYKMTGKDGVYFWFVAAFVSMMIITAGPSEGHAFEFAAYRTMETIIGVVIWTVISLLIWPRTNRNALIKTSHDLCAALAQLLDGYRKELLEHGSGEGLGEARAAAGKLAGQLQQLIAGAASESYDVSEVRGQWEKLCASSVAMLDVLDRLQPSLDDLKDIDLAVAVGDLTTFFSALDSRLRQAGGILNGAAPERHGEPEAAFGHPKLDGLNQFQQAAVEVARTELERLDQLTRAIVNSVRDIKGDAVPAIDPEPVPGRPPIKGPFGRFTPLDPDRVRATVMVVASMWISTLIWIYFNPPGHASWGQFVPNMVLIAAQNPQARFTLFKPMALAYVAILAVYVLLLPQLSDFSQLGLLLFAISFIAAYYFPGMARMALMLSMFNMLGISNEQAYNFAAQANALVFTLLGIMLAYFLTYIDRSPRPEKAFLSMVRRFFRSCEFCVAELGDPGDANSLLYRIRRAHYRHELRTLPAKLGVWGKQIDSGEFPSNSAVQVGDIVSKLQLLAYRIEDLLETRQSLRAGGPLNELSEDGRDWRFAIQNCLRDWSDQPDAHSATDLREGLAEGLTRLNHRIEDLLNRTEYEQFPDQERRKFYRMLGGYRGLSQAAIACADSAGNIDWAEWREERF